MMFNSIVSMGPGILAYIWLTYLINVICQFDGSYANRHLGVGLGDLCLLMGGNGLDRLGLQLAGLVRSLGKNQGVTVVEIRQPH